jgi:hypothetical protein
MASRATSKRRGSRRPFGGAYDLLLRFIGTVLLDRLVLHAVIAGVATLAVVLCDPELPDIMKPLPAGFIAVYDSLVSLAVVFRAAALDCDEWHDLVRHWGHDQANH